MPKLIMQKQVITVLVALSLPLASILGAGSAWGKPLAHDSDPQSIRLIAQGDPNFGPAINTGMTGSDQNDATAAGTKSDAVSPDAAQEGSTNPNGAPNTSGSTSTAGSEPGAQAATPAPSGGDASLDSMWSEAQPSSANKNKTKKKKSKSKSKDKDKSKASDSAPTSSTSSSTDLSPSPSASQPATPGTVNSDAGAASSSDSGAGTASSSSPARTPLTPSDFGAYPATTSTTSITSPTNSTPASTAAATTNSSANSSSAAATAGSAEEKDASSPSTSTVPAPATKTTAAATASTSPPSTSSGQSSDTIGSDKSSADQTKSNNTASPNVTFYAGRFYKPPAPLCATHNFFQSDLIRTVSWPGVGPFKGDTDPNDLADPQDNRLTLQTKGDKLTSAELFLGHQPGNPQAFINLQMVMDFMLEALGTKDKKISDFNGFLEKNREKLIKKQATEAKPLKTSSGSYLITIASSAPDKEQTSFLISVKQNENALEAYRVATAPEAPKSPTEESTSTGKDSRRSGSATSQTSPNTESTAGTNSGSTTGSTTIIAANVPVQRPLDTVKTDTGKSKPGKQMSAAAAIKEVKDSENIQSPKETKQANPTKETKENKQQSSADSLKQEFVDTIRNWQSIKKVAVKNQDTTELSKILSGKALDKQTVAIGWLVKKKDYYELTPKGVNVDHFEELSQSPKRYAVYALVKENSKLMDQTTSKQLSESEDQYNVKYTLERAGDHWTIYDSELVKTGAQAAEQSKGKSKTKH